MKFCKTCGQLYEQDDLEVCPEDSTVLKQVHEKSASEDPMLGQMVDGRFRVVSALGKGGFGAVYRAVQTSVGREVAIKFILEGMPPEGVRRFMREAKATSALRNIHTVTIYDFGQNDDGKLYLAMEMLEGHTLRHRLSSAGEVPWKTALHVVAQIAESLEEAHGLGMIHRDLKPGNIMLTDMGDDPNFVKVLDFGIAKFQDTGQSQITHTGSTLGSPSYMSPEQARGGDLTLSADLYSLGIILYEMLTDRVPFTAEKPVQVLFKHCTEAVPPMRDINPHLDAPPEVHNLVMTLLQKDPAARYESASQVKQVARALLAGESSDQLTAVTPAFHTPIQTSAMAPGPSVGGTDKTLAATPSTPIGMEPTVAHMPTGELPREGTDGVETGHLARVGGEDPGLPKRGSGMSIAAGIAAVALLGGAWFAFGGGAGKSDAPKDAKPAQASRAPEPAPKAVGAKAAAAKPAASAPAAKPKPTPATPVARPQPSAPPVLLQTTPPGARVEAADGRILGTTPLELKRSDKDRTLKLHLERFETAVHTVRAGASGKVPVTLKKKVIQPKRRRTTTASKPKAKPKPTPKAAKPATAPVKKKKRRSERDLF